MILGRDEEAIQQYKAKLRDKEPESIRKRSSQDDNTDFWSLDDDQTRETSELEETSQFDMAHLSWQSSVVCRDEERFAFVGADITENEGLNILMRLRNRCKISERAFGHVLEAVDQLLPQGHALPSSSYMFRQKIGADEITAVEQTFCRTHRVYVGTKEDGRTCQDCADEQSGWCLERFFTFDMHGTWRRLLEDKRVQKLVRNGIPLDKLGITRSARFLQTRVLSTEFTMSFFMDSMRLSNSKSNKQSITVVSFVCDQIPPPHRFNFARPAVIYVGEVAVDSNILLQPFIDQCIELSEEGVLWRPAEGDDEVRSKVRVMAVISDAKAKCEIQGFRQYNARDCPCTSCYDTGEKRDSGHSFTVFPFNYVTTKNAKRTDEQTRLDARAAVELLESDASDEEKNRGINGVKYPSQLLRLPKRDFDIIRYIKK